MLEHILGNEDIAVNKQSQIYHSLDKFQIRKKNNLDITNKTVIYLNFNM